VIFDEPTASLTDAEKTVLFDVIEDLKSQGVGIIYISHRMEEIFKITDRISVLRDGQYRGTLNTAETNEDEITQMMIGRKLDLSRNAANTNLATVALEVRRGCPAALYKDAVRGAPGEVVGFYGLVGAGRTEIAETLFGLREPTGGQHPAGRPGGGRSLAGRRHRQGHLAGARKPQGTGPRARHELPGQHDPAAGRVT
jgi:ABC-type sugar transport system ATPase subunit